MTSPALTELFRFALDNGIQLQQRNGKLNCRIPQAIASDGLERRLAEHKQGLIALLQEQGCTGVVAGRASFAQQRMWFVHRMFPDAALYNEPVMVRLGGELHVPSLQHALARVMQRHAVLRTVYMELCGELCQVVMPAAMEPLHDANLTHLGEQAHGHALQELRHDALHPFDLARGPLARARLFRVAPDEHLLGMVWHHICADQWSIELLLSELLASYEAHHAGQPCTLAEPLQYADFARWQCEALQ